MNHKRPLLVVIVAVSLVAAEAGASDRSHRDSSDNRYSDRFSWWVKGTFGGTSQNGDGGGAFLYGGSLNFQHGHLFLSLRATGATEIELFSRPDPGLTEISPMGGVGIGNEWFSIAALIGLGPVWETRRGKLLYREEGFLGDSVYESIEKTGCGFPFEVQLTFRFTKVIGIGFDLIGNLNTERSVVGAGFSLLLGML